MEDKNRILCKRIVEIMKVFLGQGHDTLHEIMSGMEKINWAFLIVFSTNSGTRWHSVTFLKQYM